MGVYIDDNKLVITEIKTFHFDFDLSKSVGKNLKLKIEFITKKNEFLVKHKIKNKIDQLL